MDKPDLEIKVSGGKFKIILALITLLAAGQTWFLAERQNVHFSGLQRQADSLHFVQLGVISQSTTYLELEQERTRKEILEGVGRIIIPALNKLEHNQRAMERSLNVKLDALDKPPEDTNTKLLWQLLELQQKNDTVADGPKPTTNEKNHSSITSKPRRVRN